MPISSSSGLCGLSTARRNFESCAIITLRTVGLSTTASSVCAQALDLVAQARGLLEVEIGGGLAHARLQIGDHGFEIVADGGGVAELAVRRRRRSRSARGRAHTRCP